MTLQQQKRKVIFRASKRSVEDPSSHTFVAGSNEQLQLDWGGGEATPTPATEGKRDLFPERAQAIQQFKQRFNLPINSQVRVTIKGVPGEFSGKLTLDTMAFPNRAKNAIPMRMGQVKFDLRDIESCARL